VLSVRARRAPSTIIEPVQVQNSLFPYKSRSLNRPATRRGPAKHNSIHLAEMNTVCFAHHPTQVTIALLPPFTIWLPTGMPTLPQPLSMLVSPLIRHDIYPAAGQRGKNNEENTWTLLGGLLLLCLFLCFVVLYPWSSQKVPDTDIAIPNPA
jgi:hypothetical protein